MGRRGYWCRQAIGKKAVMASESGADPDSGNGIAEIGMEIKSVESYGKG